MSEEFDYESLEKIEDERVRRKFIEAMKWLEEKDEAGRREAIYKTLTSIARALKRIQRAPAIERIKLAQKLQRELAEKREKLIVLIAYMVKPEYRPIILEVLSIISQ